MPPTSARQETRRLILLADGGALSDLNERLGLEDAPRKDFARIPEAIVKALEDEGVRVECPIDSRIFCTVGSEKAQGFLTKMAQAWTVRPFPLSVAKYERAGDPSAEKHRFRLRFHAYLGYALGLLTGAARAAGPELRHQTVLVLTDDPHLLPCMGDAKATGVDVRLVWWQSAIAEEVSYLAARNGVPTILLPADDSVTHQPQQRRDTALEQLLRSTTEGAGGLTRR